MGTFINTFSSCLASQGSLLNPLDSILNDGKTVGWFKFSNKLVVDNDIVGLKDKSGLSHDIVGEFSGNGEVLLDGISQYLKSQTFAYEKAFIYIVLKQITHVDNDVILDGYDVYSQTLAQYPSAPGNEIARFSGNGWVGSSYMPLNEYSILKIFFNGLNGKIYAHNIRQVFGDSGGSFANGITIGSRADGWGFSNIAFKEAIYRIDDSKESEIYATLTRQYAIGNTKLIEGNVTTLGDSTVAYIEGYGAVLDNINVSGKLNDISMGADVISDQWTRWNSLSTQVKSASNYVFILCGVNNIWQGQTLGNILYWYQLLVDTIKSDCPTCKVVLSTIIPCREFLGEVNYLMWLDVNESIKGEGATPIIGADIIVDLNELGDVNNNLLPAYETALNDHLHENRLGRELVASKWHDAYLSI